MKVEPSICRMKEQEFSEILTQVGRIVSQLKTPQSTVTTLLRRLKQNLSAEEKDDVYKQLNDEILTALAAGGIPRGIIHAITKMLVDMSMRDIEVVCSLPIQSIVLYLRFLSPLAMSRLKEMIHSGLLRLLIYVAIEQFIRSRPESRLVFQAEDFKLSLSYRDPESMYVNPLPL